MVVALRVLEPLAKLIEVVVMILLSLFVVVVFMMVSALFVDRYFVRVPIMAPDEISKIAIVWMTFLGFSLAINDRTNIRVDLIDKRLTPGQAAWLDLAFTVAMLAMTVWIVSKSWILVVIGQGQSILGTPFNAGLTNLGFFIGGVLTAFFCIMRILRSVAAMQASAS